MSGKQKQFINKHNQKSGSLEARTEKVITNFNQPKTEKQLSKFDRRVMAVLKKTSEPNSFDVIQAAQSVDYSGLYVILSAVTVGNGDSNRTGDKFEHSS